LLRSNNLSDDIAFRFEQDRKFSVGDFAQWIYNIPGDDSIVTLGMDYETFGEHHKASTGIISFLEELIGKLHTDKVVTLNSPSPLFRTRVAKEKLDIHDFVSWADESKDISAWLGNDIQCDAFKTLQSLEDSVMKTANSDMIETWRNLQTSDHFYYMSTKVAQDGNVHSHFSHYGSPYEAFINYMNTLTDLAVRARSPLPVMLASRDEVNAGFEHSAETA